MGLLKDHLLDTLRPNGTSGLLNQQASTSSRIWALNNDHQKPKHVDAKVGMN